MAKKNRSKADEDESLKSADSLGGLISRHGVQLAGILLVTGVAGAVGLVLVGYGLNRDPASWIVLGIGAFLLLTALALLVTNLANIGRKLEIRKKGIRYVEFGAATELLWEDIIGVKVDRSDETDMGLVSVRRRGSHHAVPSGPLTKTDWDVTIQGSDGQSIHLRPRFLKIIPDVSKLITQIKMRSGMGK